MTCAEPPICRQTALECTKPRIKFQKISGGNTPDPHTLGTLSPDFRGEGREGKGRRKGEGGREREEERERDNSFVAAPLQAHIVSCHRLCTRSEEKGLDNACGCDG